jgi:hypothetical protein
LHDLHRTLNVAPSYAL